MNFFIKNKLSLSIVLISIVLIYSCSKDEVSPILSSELKIDSNNLSKLEKESTNVKIDDLKYLKNSNLLLSNTHSDINQEEDDIEIISLQTSTVYRKNLNDVFTSYSSSNEILALTLLEDNNQNIDGIIIYYSDSDKNLKLEAFNKNIENEVFELIDFPANLVSDFTLENLLFLARKTFPRRNLITYGVNEIVNTKGTNKFDNISLLNFASRNNLLKNKGRYKGLINKNEIENTQYRLPGGSGPNMCAVAVHHCTNGDTRRTVCAPFDGGCRAMPSGGCPEAQVDYALESQAMYVELNDFNSNLDEERLYDFRDWLVTTPGGEFYTAVYYTLPSHFEKSLDVSLLIDIVAASYDMKIFVDAMMSDDPNYILTEAVFNKFMNILQKSSDNSTSLEYKDIISSLIAGFQDYKSKDVAGIKSLLNN